METLLQQLTAIPSPSGFEHRVIRFLRDTLKDHVDEWNVAGLGKGPGIKAMDASLIASPKVRRKLQNLCKEMGIPCQTEIFTGIGTDAGELHGSHSGVPSSVISIPSRYAHSPNEEMDLTDFAQCRALLDAFILSMKDKDEFRFV